MDLAERDPHELNSHVKVEFDEVIAEPSGAHSYDCCWENCTFTCFNCSKSCLYKFLTTLLSCLIAPVWGCAFAFLTFFMVWFVTPMFRGCSIVMGCCQMFVGTSTMCLCAPIFDAVALILSRIQVGMETLKM
ncbi:caveolin-1-like [Saccostrea cucullata]|uniref:caveolin-1-like n=1 Tax=Saccostrea cuccullata TaxID=36930 RepID=UPI002ED19A52